MLGVKLILEYKWNNYFKWYFLEDLVIFSVFLVCETYYSIMIIPQKYVRQDLIEEVSEEYFSP